MAQLEEADDVSVDAGKVDKLAERQTSKSTKDPTYSDNTNGSGSGEEDEEEYEIEAIIDAKRGKFKPGEYGYLVKWRGYGPEHNMWVSESDAENAKELIDEYFKKNRKVLTKPLARGRSSVSAKPLKEQDGRKDASPAVESAGKSAAKRGRGKGRGKAVSVSADEASEDEDAPKMKKKQRVGASTSANGSRSAKRGSLAALDKTDDEDVMMAVTNGMEVDDSDEVEKYTTMKDLKMSSIKNWEDYVKQVKTVERLEDGLMIYFETTDNKYVREPSSTCAKRFPQKLIEFYESHLRWKLAEDDVGDS